MHSSRGGCLPRGCLPGRCIPAHNGADTPRQCVKKIPCPKLPLRAVIMLVSLHIRSMWETICDAWACWSGWKFGPNSAVYPYSAIQNTPPPEMKIVRNLGTLTFQLHLPPPPREMKIVRNLGTLTFQLQITPPPPENWNLGRSWHFVIFQLQITPPPRKWKFQKSWHFDFSVADYPPPPPENWNLGRSWHFVIFQLQITPPPKIET